MTRGAVPVKPIGLGVGLVILGTSLLLVGHRVVRAQATTPPGTVTAPGSNPAQAAPGRPAPPPPDKKVIEGTDNNDAITAGDGDDWIFAGKGDDFIYGGKGDDTIEGGAGDDTIDGGAGNDVIGGPDGVGSDTIRGGDGRDTIDSGDDDDLLDGGAGNDDLDGGDGNDILRGGADNDVLDGGDGDDNLSGGAGVDRLTGGEGRDTIFGGAGNDILSGANGDDNLTGDAGDDMLDGGQGNDVLRAGAGNDTLLGGWGNDLVEGNEGHDTLSGGDGKDIVNGGSGDDWLLGGTEADVVNGGDGDDIIVLRAGDVPAADFETVDGEGGNDVLILSGFIERPSIVAGESRILDPITGGTYRLLHIERVEYTQFVPDFSTDQNQSSSLLLINPSSTTPSVGRVVFFGREGLAATPTMTGATGPRPVGFTVPPLGSLRLDAPPQAARPGSVQIFASSPLGSLVRTNIPALGSADMVESPLVDSVKVPVFEEQASGARTGVVIFNSTIDSQIKFTLHNPNGTEVTTFAVVIDAPPNGQRIVWVRDLFPSLGDFQGSVIVGEDVTDRPQHGGPQAMTVVQRTGTAFTTYPGVPMNPLPAAKTLHFAKVPSGGESVSSLVLVNPSGFKRAKGTVSFFDDGGRGWSVSLNRQPGAVTIPFDLAEDGSMTLTTPMGGPAQTGSIRAEVTEGVIRGILRVNTAAGLSAVEPNAALDGFIAPARRVRASGVNTEIALASTGAPITVQVVLRDASGAEVPGGTSEMSLAANARSTRTLDELFPRANADSFQGTLTVKASGGTVAATVTETGNNPARATIMPVLQLR